MIGRIFSIIGIFLFLIIVIKLLGLDPTFLYELLDMLKVAVIDFYNLLIAKVGKEFVYIAGATLVILIIFGRSR